MVSRTFVMYLSGEPCSDQNGVKVKQVFAVLINVLTSIWVVYFTVMFITGCRLRKLLIFLITSDSSEPGGGCGGWVWPAAAAAIPIG